MFKEFKKNKIRKLISTEKNNVFNKLKNNDINLLEAHYILENSISKIYNENNFCYQDLLNRKRELTSFRTNINNILVSFLFGILVNVICNLIIYASNELFTFNSIICDILMVIFVIVIIFIVSATIPKNAKILSNIDPYNVEQYELEIIEKALQEYEDKKPEL